MAVPAAVWVATAYFAEGLPYSLVHQVSAQLFVDLGTSLTAVGLTALFGLAWNLKFLWSPLVGRAGSLRGWVLACQGLLLALTLCLIPPVARGDVGRVAAILALVAFVAATQDVAVDGAYLVDLPERDHARFAGLRIAAYRVAILFASGGVVAFAGRQGWVGAIGLVAAALAALLATHALILPRDRSPLPPARGGDLVRALGSYLSRPHAAACVAFVLLFRAGDALLFAMAPPLLRDLGLDTEARGVLGGVGTAASVAGAMLGGALLARVGLRRALFPIAALQALALPLYSLLAALRPGPLGIGACVVVEQLVAGVGTAALAVFLMRRSEGPERVAHFAVGSALMSVATTAVGSVSGVLAERVGFVPYFLVAFAAAIPGVFVARAVTRSGAVG